MKFVYRIVFYEQIIILIVLLETFFNRLFYYGDKQTHLIFIFLFLFLFECFQKCRQEFTFSLNTDDQNQPDGASSVLENELLDCTIMRKVNSNLFTLNTEEFIYN